MMPVPVPLAKVATEYWLFGGAGLVSLAAFIGLILVPAVGSYGRAWERVAAGFLSLFVLVALVGAGVAIGLFVVYHYNDIVDTFS
jgi:hypothetical protein